MKYTGPIFRPPPEANTLLLQTTVGCTHNKCTFCTMYKGTRFSVEHIDQIEKDLKEAKSTYGSLTRIFLVNGDAFALNGRRLKEISKKIIEYFPEMQTITMYASIRNIKHKTNKELRELRDLRINDLWVGLESGNDDVLKYMKKGYTLDVAYKQLARLNEVGIRHHSIFMLGVAGSGKGIQNAVDTTNLINATKPALVGFTTLGVFDGSQLAEDVAQNLFTPATELEILEEEKRIIELIELKNLLFFGAHPTNAANINGILPDDRVEMIETIDHAIETADEAFLNSTLRRSTL